MNRFTKYVLVLSTLVVLVIISISKFRFRATKLSPALPTFSTTPAESSHLVDQFVGNYKDNTRKTRCVFSADTGDRAGAKIVKLTGDLGIKCLAIAGDVIYPDGSLLYFHKVVEPYLSGLISSQNVFVVPGNHDWWQGYPEDLGSSWDPGDLPLCQAFPYLPKGQGKCRYYRVLLSDDVELFFFDSDRREPDGNTSSSVQGKWLQEALSSSHAKWKLVVTHEPPVSSCSHTSSSAVAGLPLIDWGADALITGHCHHYERSVFRGIPLFVVGVGGESRYDFKKDNPQLAPSDSTHSTRSKETGVLTMSATHDSLTLEFVTLDGQSIDSLVINK